MATISTRLKTPGTRGAFPEVLCGPQENDENPITAEMTLLDKGELKCTSPTSNATPPNLRMQLASEARRTFALRTHCHDQLADSPAFLGDALWIQKSLSRMRHASISIYKTNLPK